MNVSTLEDCLVFFFQHAFSIFSSQQSSTLLLLPALFMITLNLCICFLKRGMPTWTQDPSTSQNGIIISGVGYL